MKPEEIEEMAIEFRRLRNDFSIMAALVEELDDFLMGLESCKINGWDMEITKMRHHTNNAMKEILSANTQHSEPTE